MAFNKSALVAWREGIGASQTDAAQILGITQPYLSELETGKKEPSFPLAERIAQITGITMSDSSELDPPAPRQRRRSRDGGGAKAA